MAQRPNQNIAIDTFHLLLFLILHISVFHAKESLVTRKNTFYMSEINHSFLLFCSVQSIPWHLLSTCVKKSNYPKNVCCGACTFVTFRHWYAKYMDATQKLWMYTKLTRFARYNVFSLVGGKILFVKGLGNFASADNLINAPF